MNVSVEHLIDAAISLFDAQPVARGTTHVDITGLGQTDATIAKSYFELTHLNTHQLSESVEVDSNSPEPGVHLQYNLRITRR